MFDSKVIKKLKRMHAEVTKLGADIDKRSELTQEFQWIAHDLNEVTRLAKFIEEDVESIKRTLANNFEVSRANMTGVSGTNYSAKINLEHILKTLKGIKEQL